MTEHEKLLDKIQKLLAKGHGTDNADEAAAFLSKAAQMMEEHNLTHKDIGRAQIGRVEIKSTQSVSKMKDWEYSLIYVVSQAFGCKVQWMAGNSKYVDYWGRFVLYGHKERVLLAEYSATVLLRQLVKERAKFSSVLARQGYKRGPAMTAQLDGFCKGWIKIVRAKVSAFANSAELQAAIDEYVKENSTGKKVPRHNRGAGTLGFYQGMDAAADVHLHRPMSREEQLKLGK